MAEKGLEWQSHLMALNGDQLDPTYLKLNLVAAEISPKEAGADFVATATEANLPNLVMAVGQDPAIHHVATSRNLRT